MQPLTSAINVILLTSFATVSAVSYLKVLTKSSRNLALNVGFTHPVLGHHQAYKLRPEDFIFPLLEHGVFIHVFNTVRVNESMNA